jgi:hypothetical protein
MSSKEYIELKEQMDRIERLLLRLAGTPDVGAGSPVVPVVPAADLPGEELFDANQVRIVQEQGHFILETQGLKAYQEFWKQQGKKRKPRIKRAA